MESRWVFFLVVYVSEFMSALNTLTTYMFMNRRKQNIIFNITMSIRLFNHLLVFLKCLCAFSPKFVSKK